MVEIEYSRHLRERLKLRRIEENLPENIFKTAGERFEDLTTGHLIAICRMLLHGRERDVMVAYRQSGIRVKLLTIHPLKNGQKEQRLDSGRWRRLP